MARITLIQKLPPRERGTRVTLDLKAAHPNIDLPAGDDDDDGPDTDASADNRPPAEAFTDLWTIKRVVKKHSDFIAYPILIDVDKQETPTDDEGKPIEGAEPKRWVGRRDAEFDAPALDAPAKGYRRKRV